MKRETDWLATFAVGVAGGCVLGIILVALLALLGVGV